MKRFLLLLLVISMACITANAKKPKPIIKYRLAVTNVVSEKGKQISFSCSTPSEYSTSFIIGFHIENNTDERIYIEWENARITDSRVVFGNDSRITMGNPKADEAVSAHSNSIRRDITGELYIGSNWVLDLYNPKKLKKNLGSVDVTFIKIPIKYKDGTVEEFDLTFAVWYEMPPVQ